ncbi:hypothetical protein PYCC9005_000744 [Savitreella phatthalungensis]
MTSRPSSARDTAAIEAERLREEIKESASELRSLESLSVRVKMRSPSIRCLSTAGEVLSDIPNGTHRRTASTITTRKLEALMVERDNLQRANNELRLRLENEGREKAALLRKKLLLEEALATQRSAGDSQAISLERADTLLRSLRDRLSTTACELQELVMKRNTLEEQLDSVSRQTEMDKALIGRLENENDVLQEAHRKEAKRHRDDIAGLVSDLVNIRRNLDGREEAYRAAIEALNAHRAANSALRVAHEVALESLRRELVDTLSRNAYDNDELEVQ